MCFNFETIEVPRTEVISMLEQGATYGECLIGQCCPQEVPVEGKIDMCLNGRTINVSLNACEGILQAGGSCGACPIVNDPPPEEPVLLTKDKAKKK